MGGINKKGIKGGGEPGEEGAGGIDAPRHLICCYDLLHLHYCYLIFFYHFLHLPKRFLLFLSLFFSSSLL